MAGVGTALIQGDRGYVAGIAGVSDNDIVIETEDVGNYDTFEIASSAGAMDIEVDLGNGTFIGPIAIADLGAVSLEPVIVTAAARLYGFVGNFYALRIRQNGATAVANPILRFYRSK